MHDADVYKYFKSYRIRVAPPSKTLQELFIGQAHLTTSNNRTFAYVVSCIFDGSAHIWCCQETHRCRYSSTQWRNKSRKLNLQCSFVPATSENGRDENSTGGLMLVGQGELTFDPRANNIIDRYSHACYLRLKEQTVCVINV